MKKRIRLIAVLAALAMVVAACGTGEAGDDGEDGEPTTTTTAAPATTTTQAPTTTTTEAEPIELVIWADEGRSEVFSTVTPAFTEDPVRRVLVELHARADHEDVDVLDAGGTGRREIQEGSAFTETP